MTDKQVASYCTPRLFVYLFGRLRRKRYGLPRGAAFVVCLAEFSHNEDREAKKYADTLASQTGHSAVVLWDTDGCPIAPIGQVFYHGWFFR